MAKIIINYPQDISLSHRESDAMIQTTRVVSAMARWFGVDVRAEAAIGNDPSKKGSYKILSFTFEGEQARVATENIEFFMKNNSDLRYCHIPVSHADKSAGIASVKMNLDMLSRIDARNFEMAATDAGHNGLLITQSIARQAQGGKTPS